MEECLLDDDNWLKCPHCKGLDIKPVDTHKFRCQDCHAGPPDPMYKDYTLQFVEIDGCTKLRWNKKKNLE